VKTTEEYFVDKYCLVAFYILKSVLKLAMGNSVLKRKESRAYMVATAHLDTQWLWTIQVRAGGPTCGGGYLG
jgi:hypothetical protein